MRKLTAAWGENFDEYRLDLERTIDVGNRVVTLVIQRGRIKGTTSSTEQQIGW